MDKKQKLDTTILNTDLGNMLEKVLYTIVRGEITAFQFEGN